MKTKNFLLLILLILLAGGAIAGAFVGGKIIGKNQATQEISQTFQSRVSQFGSGGARQFSQEGQGSISPGGVIGGIFTRNGTLGTVEKVESNILTLAARDGTRISVVVSDNTTIERMSTGTINDVLAGSNVTINGERNADGSIQATSIFVLPTLIGQP